MEGDPSAESVVQRLACDSVSDRAGKFKFPDRQAVPLSGMACPIGLIANTHDNRVDDHAVRPPQT